MPKPRKSLVSLEATPIIIAFPVVCAAPFFVARISSPGKTLNIADNGLKTACWNWPASLLLILLHMW